MGQFVVIKEISSKEGNSRRPVHQDIIPFDRINLQTGLHRVEKKSQRFIINTLNHLHFTENSIFAVMIFMPTGDEFLVTVKPEPCVDENFSCILPKVDTHDLSQFVFKHLILDDGQKVMLIPGTVRLLTKNRLEITLPKTGIILNTRQAKRFQSRFIEVILKKKGQEFTGSLDDFSSSGLRISLHEDQLQAFEASEMLEIILKRMGSIIYSGSGSIQRISENDKSIVIIPSLDSHYQYAQRSHRHQRYRISPTPQIEFHHPITDKTVTYDVLDLNTAGFSIREHSDKSVFIPGMIFEQATIIFSGEFSINFSSRTVYSDSQRGNMSKIGFAITDMDPVSYRRLFNVVSRAYDPHSLALGKVSTESLWQFFFKSGFVYPEKYRCISNNKEHFQRIYEKLYNDCPDLFASLTYQQNDEIYGHVSLFKAYPKAWMVQHLAAIPMDRKRTGLFILNNILDFLDGFHRMNQVGMDYLIFNYRPENRFPNFFFSGVCRTLNAPQMCSIDTSAYLMHRLPDKLEDLSLGWNLRPCGQSDILGLKKAYKNHSQGLFIDSFCLDSKDDDLWMTYQKYGLKRNRTPYVLENDGISKAYFVVERSDRGLNLSELMNSIRVFLPDTDPHYMPWNILKIAIDYLGQEYHSPEIVLQIFPVEYCIRSQVPFKKRYTTWIAKTSYFDPHFDAIKKMSQFKYFKFVKSLIKEMFGFKDK